MLDGHENTLEVADSDSQPKFSPAKQKNQAVKSPMKQKTLDSFLKQCSNMDDHDSQPKIKYPRH